MHVHTSDKDAAKKREAAKGLHLPKNSLNSVVRVQKQRQAPSAQFFSACPLELDPESLGRD